MRKRHYSEEQIIGVLRLAEAGQTVAEVCRQQTTRRQRDDLLPLECAVWRAGSQPVAATAATRRGESQAQAERKRPTRSADLWLVDGRDACCPDLHICLNYRPGRWAVTPWVTEP